MNHRAENTPVLKQAAFEMLSARFAIIISDAGDWTLRHHSGITEHSSLYCELMITCVYGSS